MSCDSTIYLILPFYNFPYTFAAYPLHSNSLIRPYALNLTERLRKYDCKGKYLIQNNRKTTSQENECIRFQCTVAGNQFSKRQQLFSDHQKHRYDVLKITSKHISVSLSLCQQFKYGQKLTFSKIFTEIKLFISIRNHHFYLKTLYLSVSLQVFLLLFNTRIIYYSKLNSCM